MNTTQIFKDKYKEISEQWNLNKSVCTRIINRYSKKLQEEISDPTPMTLPPRYKDIRTPKQYIFDLCEGWLVEDLILAWLRSRLPGLKVGRGGRDGDRIIQRTHSGRIQTKADLWIRTPRGIKKPVEIQISRQPEQARFDIKETKITKLRRKCGLIMFILLPEDKFFIVYPRQIFTAGKRPEPNPAYGGKLCYTFTRKEVEQDLGLYPLSGDLSEDLCKRIGIR